ncbi:MAG TPA: metallophosphoesterase family protein [Burkholderiaceae bacterium]|nr:metallophosphoesterase family protein [Burkholderiaceae bacterium]
MRRIGLISDTHGLLRPQALAFLRGCDAIVHGGDICDAGVLDELARIAPVTAVRGNNDHGAWADALRDSELVRFGAAWVYAIHDLAQLGLAPHSAGVHVVVSGHSHKPTIAQRDGVLYINPGSAGPRRFRLPIAIGELVIDGRSIDARVVELDVQSDRPTTTQIIARHRLVIEPMS